MFSRRARRFRLEGADTISTARGTAIRVALGVIVALVLNHLFLGGLFVVDLVVIAFSIVYFFFHRGPIPTGFFRRR